MERRFLRILLALNRIYLPDPYFKWLDQLIPQMTITPPRLRDRLETIFSMPLEARVAELQRLFAETLDCVEDHLAIDVGYARTWLTTQRPVQDNPPPQADELGKL